jgi:copper chaperone for superoxide dismutase
MTCEGCIKSISNALHAITGKSTQKQPGAFHRSNPATGINKVDANLKDQLVFVEGTAAPSEIVTAIEGTGRDAILRGSGNTDSTGSPDSYSNTPNNEQIII